MYADKSIIAASLRFSWVIENTLAASARPGRYGPATEHFIYLKDSGIKTIINLCEDPLISPDGYAQHFNIVHFPILDGDIPTEDQMEEILETAEESVRRKTPCVVHCQGGVGRTATVLVPVLMRLKGLTMDEAFDVLRQSGRHTQTMQQFEFVQDWAARKATGHRQQATSKK